jgi:hypothetical protein
MSERLISACGMVCSDCDAHKATQADDAAAAESVAALWTQQFGVPIPTEAVWCDGCMTGGDRTCAHVGECEIRACVVGRGLQNCAGCSDYACDQLQKFFAMAPGVQETLESLRA